MSDAAIDIRQATSADALRRCHAVMVQLRPNVDEAAFVAQAQRQAAQGYRVAALEEGGIVRAVAGYRLMETFFSGRLLYVDDLVTDQAHRSRGHGRRLLAWLVDEARRCGCATLELDSGVQRKEAHAFYFRENMRVDSFHFRIRLDA